jgi:hypothetical protein
MGASSELPFAAESVPSVLFAERAQAVRPQYVVDEEFPPDLPVTYDWMLQPASQLRFRRGLGFLAVIVAALLISVSFYLVRRLPSLTVPISAGLAVIVLVAVAFRVCARQRVGLEPSGRD